MLRLRRSYEELGRLRLGLCLLRGCLNEGLNDLDSFWGLGLHLILEELAQLTSFALQSLLFLTEKLLIDLFGILFQNSPSQLGFSFGNRLFPLHQLLVVFWTFAQLLLLALLLLNEVFEQVQSLGKRFDKAMFQLVRRIFLRVYLP